MTDTQTENKFRIQLADENNPRESDKKTDIYRFISQKVSDYHGKLLNDKIVSLTIVKEMVDKFIAAAFHLQWGNYRYPKLFNLAALLKRSYKLLRKWRTEETFLKLVDQLVSEYFDGFMTEYLYYLRLFHLAMDEADANPVARKYLAKTAYTIATMIRTANNSWGRLIHEKGFTEIPTLIKQQKDPRIAGHLYVLLLICSVRLKGKLKLPVKEARQYRQEFHEFIKRLLTDMRNETKKGHPIRAARYAEVVGIYSILMHDKLAETHFEIDDELEDVSLVELHEAIRFEDEEPA